MEVAVGVTNIVGLGEGAIVDVLYAYEECSGDLRCVVAVLQVHDLDAGIVVVVVHLQLVVQARAHHGWVLECEGDIVIRIGDGYAAERGYVWGVGHAEVLEGVLATGDLRLRASATNPKYQNPKSKF